MDVNKSCVRSVRIGRKVSGVGLLPKSADLGSALEQRGPADRYSESIISVALKDERDLAGTPDVGCLSRTAIGVSNPATSPRMMTCAIEKMLASQKKAFRVTRKTPRTMSGRSHRASDLTMIGFGVVTPATAKMLEITMTTGEIAQQISSIQIAREESVSAIKNITDTINRVPESSSMIAVAVDEQGAATRQFARNVPQASQGTSSVASNINDVQREVFS